MNIVSHNKANTRSIDFYSTAGSEDFLTLPHPQFNPNGINEAARDITLVNGKMLEPSRN